MFTLSWDGFKNGEFAVQCKTEKDAVDFIKSVKLTDIDHYGLDFSTWRIFEEDSCYFININDKLDLAHMDYCNYNNIPVVVWKKEN